MTKDDFRVEKLEDCLGRTVYRIEYNCNKLGSCNDKEADASWQYVREYMSHPDEADPFGFYSGSVCNYTSEYKLYAALSDLLEKFTLKHKEYISTDEVLEEK